MNYTSDLGTVVGFSPFDEYAMFSDSAYLHYAQERTIRALKEYKASENVGDAHRASYR